jgi:hypothetical protein
MGGTQLRLVFLDDSEQPDPPRRGLGQLLAVGCVLVPERAVAGYGADLAAIRAQLGLPPGEEIKWKPARNSFLANAGGEFVTTLRTRMLEAAIDWDIRSAVVVWDHDAAWRDRPKQEVGREILKYLYERISMCLSDYDDVGIVIADKPGGGSVQETQWLAGTLQLTNAGTEYVTPDRIVLPIVTAPSHHVPHLQLADLVTAATTAAVAGRPSGLQLRELCSHWPTSTLSATPAELASSFGPGNPTSSTGRLARRSGHCPRRCPATTCRTPTGTTAPTTA